MARSGEAVVVALLAGTLLGGCTTTQQKSARSKVVANRLLASRKPMLVTRSNPAIQVLGVTLVGRRAFVVRLRNRRDKLAEDLPISVGVRPGRYLNRRGGLGYLNTHVPAIAARSEAIWVFTTSRAAPRGAPFARVGVGATTPAARVPAVRARVAGSAVRVVNASSIPQYDLGVFAVASRGGRVVAAGRAAIKHLGTGASTTVRLGLVGRARGAALHVSTAPSTLR